MPAVKEVGRRFSIHGVFHRFGKCLTSASSHSLGSLLWETLIHKFSQELYRSVIKVDHCFIGDLVFARSSISSEFGKGCTYLCRGDGLVQAQVRGSCAIRDLILYVRKVSVAKCSDKGLLARLKFTHECLHSPVGFSFASGWIYE